MEDDTGRALPLTGLILAGGAGRRMGGRDKGWLLWRGRPLIRHALEHFEGKAVEILISANRNQARYAALGHRVLADAVPGYQGPLMGLRRGLESAGRDWVLSLPVDAPALPADTVARLWARREDAPIVVARSPGGPQPVLCLCRRDRLPDLQRYLDAGGRKARDWFRALPHVWVDFEEKDFFNCNHPTDLQELSGE